jgi:hypothetical protein
MNLQGDETPRFARVMGASIPAGMPPLWVHTPGCKNFRHLRLPERPGLAAFAGNDPLSPQATTAAHRRA